MYILEAVTTPTVYDGLLVMIASALFIFCVLMGMRGQKVWNMMAIAFAIYLGFVFAESIPFLIAIVGTIIYLMSDIFMGWNK